ncbi:MAG: helix-turn-helix domain-containing protein [Eubacteriales bacterium]
MEFRDRLMELRKQKGLSQEELGYSINVSRQTVSKWELGETTPEMSKLEAIADLFEVSLDYLVKGEAMPAGARRRGEYEYKSIAQINGMPVIHINLGRGIKKARGVVAVGNVATGVVAVGGVAIGVVAFGGLSIGIVTLAGMALGLVALGGLSAGYIAVGGVAVGYLAIGGAAFGINALGGVAIARDIAFGEYARGRIAIGSRTYGEYQISRYAEKGDMLNMFSSAVKSIGNIKPWIVDFFRSAINNG